MHDGNYAKGVAAFSNGVNGQNNISPVFQNPSYTYRWKDIDGRRYQSG
jgi:hypothetical protein